jgi:hypothetical protein
MENEILKERVEYLTAKNEEINKQILNALLNQNEE